MYRNNNTYAVSSFDRRSFLKREINCRGKFNNKKQAEIFILKSLHGTELL